MNAVIDVCKTTVQRTWKRSAAVLVLTTGLFVAAGCVAPVPPRPVVPPLPGKVVIIPKGHVHSVRCGHYRYKGKWYYHKGHVHRPGCGHVKVRGVWVLKI